MNDHQLIHLFEERDEQAISGTRERYGAYIRSIALRILHDAPDAEETENDVYWKLWNTIPPEKPASLRSYAAMLCRQNAIDRLRAADRVKRGGGEADLALDELSESIPDESRDAIPDALALKDTLERFLQGLGRKEKQLFLQRYWYFCSVRELAESFSMSEAAVKMRLYRIREKLRKHLEKEEFTL